MVTWHHISGTATVICLLWKTNISTASPLYNNATDVASSDETYSRSPIIIAGSAVVTTREKTSLPAIPTPTSKNTSSTYTGEPFYGTVALAGSDWRLFESKTLRPTSSVSWASSMPEVEKCWSDIVNWRDSSISWWNRYIASSTFSKRALTTETIDWRITGTTRETTIYPTSVSAYTLCDGSPRVDVRPETRTTTFNVTFSSTNMYPKEFAFPQTQPCIPDPKTCRLWYYESNINVTNRDELYQQCGHPTGLYEPCIVSGGPVQLIYWPEENDEGGICPNNASKSLYSPEDARKTSTVGLPKTVTALGHTFTSGSVYLSFHTLYASYDGFYDKIGPTFKDTIIPVPSSAISTHCGGFTEAHGPATSLNYADINWPVAASAYNCQARCDHQRFVPRANRTANPTECQTIWSDVNPNIAIPTMVKDLVPEWAHCEMSGFRLPNFWFDPPVKLTKRQSIVVPTTSYSKPTSEPAAPSSRFTSPAPLETGSTQGEGPSYEDTSGQALPSGWPAQAEASSAEAISHENGHQALSSVLDHTSDSDNIALPRPPDKALSAEDIHDEATLTLNNASDDFTGRFTYQPQTSSLNALSVLESALSSALSGPRAAPTFATETGTTDSTYSPSGTVRGSVDVPSSAPSEAPADSPSSKSAISVDPIHTSYDTSLPIVTGSAGQSTHASFASSSGPSISSPPSQTDVDTQKTDVRTGEQSPSASASTGSAQQPLPSVVLEAPSEERTLVAGDLTLTVSNALALQSHTFDSDNQIATMDGQVISAAPSGLVLVSSNSVVTFSEVPEITEVQLAAGSITVTAKDVQSSSGAISIEGTTLAEDGDIATLDGGQVLSFGSTGIAMIQSDTTAMVSTVSGTSAATSSSEAYSTSMEWPTEASESKPVEGRGTRSLGYTLDLACIFAFAVTCAML